jgi:predicted nicotinamide N-methyase
MDAILTIQQIAKDPDASMELGALGTHKQLAKAATGGSCVVADANLSEEAHDDALEQIASALAACGESLPPGTPFPSKPVLQAVMGLKAVTELADTAATAASHQCCQFASATIPSHPAVHAKPAATSRHEAEALSTTEATPGSVSSALITKSHWLLSPQPTTSEDAAASSSEAPSSVACNLCGKQMATETAALVKAEAQLSRDLRKEGLVPDLPFVFTMPEPCVTPAAATASTGTGPVDVWARERCGSDPADGPKPPRLREQAILVRKLSMRMASHDDVGAVLWPAAGVLSRWLLDRPWLLRDKTMMEIGAGMGLTGIIASTLCSSAVLTDFNSAIIKNLAQNVQLNSGTRCFEPSDSPAACALHSSRVSAGWMDWDSIGTATTAAAAAGSAPGAGLRAASCPDGVVDARKTVADVILATDMVISQSDCQGVARACNHCLAADGYALFAVAPPDVRFGTEFLKGALESHGFTVLQQTIAPEYAIGSEFATAGGYESRIQLYAAFR